MTTREVSMTSTQLIRTTVAKANHAARRARRDTLAMLALIAASTAASAAFVSSGASALAPEAARLNNTLYTSTSAAYTPSNTATTAYYLSAANWTYAPSIPVGAPCSSTWALPAGTVITSVVQGNGSYRRCV
jgi:hypothetical protein